MAVLALALQEKVMLLLACPATDADETKSVMVPTLVHHTAVKPVTNCRMHHVSMTCASMSDVGGVGFYDR